MLSYHKESMSDKKQKIGEIYLKGTEKVLELKRKQLSIIEKVARKRDSRLIDALKKKFGL